MAVVLSIAHLAELRNRRCVWRKAWRGETRADEAPAAAPPAIAFQVLRGPDRAGRVRKEQDRLSQRIAAQYLGKVRDPSGALGLHDLQATMSDNASEFRSQEFEAAVARLGARHIFIRAGRPQTNGSVERVQQTILRSAGSRPSPATSSPSTRGSTSTSTSSATSGTRTPRHLPRPLGGHGERRPSPQRGP